MKILVADDDGVCRRLTEAALSADGHEVVLAEDGRQAWDALCDGDFDIAVLDWMMPEMDGVELCRRIRQRASSTPVYIILLTSRGEHEDVVTGLDAGADEYLVKPFDADELRARIRAGARIVELERSLLRANERLEVLASTDELTGLMNRRSIVARLKEELSRSQRERTPLSIIAVDVDHFKRINDEHGHAAGDSVLRDLSRRLSSAVRPYDALGRLGGDEFLLLLPGADEQEALSVGERMRISTAGQPSPVDCHTPLPVTASFGIAGAGNMSRPETILATADEALYEAKRQGGNCACLAHSATELQHEEREPRQPVHIKRV